ncbi:unnamed protein product [Amoebophrya sp. A25]|nr:unnamed protein product [Amoebophrya sp. A25]|eukprot:GSA25T00027368001.1
MIEIRARGRDLTRPGQRSYADSSRGSDLLTLCLRSPSQSKDHHTKHHAPGNAYTYYTYKLEKVAKCALATFRRVAHEIAGA